MQLHPTLDVATIASAMNKNTSTRRRARAFVRGMMGGMDIGAVVVQVHGTSFTRHRLGDDQSLAQIWGAVGRDLLLALRKHQAQ